MGNGAFRAINARQTSLVGTMLVVVDDVLAIATLLLLMVI
jgi:hypothetical protein